MQEVQQVHTNHKINGSFFGSFYHVLKTQNSKLCTSSMTAATAVWVFCVCVCVQMSEAEQKALCT